MNFAFKFIFVAILLWGTCCITLAQKRLYIGLKVGGNVSKTTKSEYEFLLPGGKTSNRARFGANLNSEHGIVLNYKINEKFSFQPELLKVKKGYQAFGIYNDENGRADKNSYEKWVNTHFEMPILFKLSAGDESSKLFFAVGPYFSYWKDSYYIRNSFLEKTGKQKLTVEHEYVYTVEKEVGKRNVNGIDEPIYQKFDSITVKAPLEKGIVFATGYQFKFRKSLFFFDLRYAYGLSKFYKFLEDERPLNFLNDIPPVEQPKRREDYNRRFSITQSYLFAFKE